MHIALLCATDRGYRVAERLFQLGRGHQFSVFSFRETAWEPLFFDRLRELTTACGHQFIEARNVARPSLNEFWQQTTLDLLLMVSWRYLVPREVYLRARCGSFVFHDSMLPCYRGFAPTVWAMINGESHTGVTVFRASDEMDAGDIVEQRSVPIADSDTIANVMERVTLTYLDIAEQNFSKLLDGNVNSYPQDHSKATYTCKWTPADAVINWSKASRDIYNLVRATSRPYPGAYTYMDGRKLTVWSAALPKKARNYVANVPGRVVSTLSDQGAAVLTGDGPILLRSVQLEGEPIIDASALLQSPSQSLGGRNRQC